VRVSRSVPFQHVRRKSLRRFEFVATSAARGLAVVMPRGGPPSHSPLMYYALPGILTPRPMLSWVVQGWSRLGWEKAHYPLDATPGKCLLAQTFGLSSTGAYAVHSR
jgi:hypothetical protein